MKGVGKTNRLFFNGFPTGMKATDVIREIAGKKTMLFSLNGLFEPFA